MELIDTVIRLLASPMNSMGFVAILCFLFIIIGGIKVIDDKLRQTDDTIAYLARKLERLEKHLGIEEVKEKRKNDASKPNPFHYPTYDEQQKALLRRRNQEYYPKNVGLSVRSWESEDERKAYFEKLQAIQENVGRSLDRSISKAQFMGDYHSDIYTSHNPRIDELMEKGRSDE